MTDVSQPPVLTLVGSQAIAQRRRRNSTGFSVHRQLGRRHRRRRQAIQTFTLMLKDPIGGPSLSTQTTVVQSLRTPGSEGVATTGSFDVVHLYLGPPNPLNPSADITVTVTVFDDNLGSTRPASQSGTRASKSSTWRLIRRPMWRVRSSSRSRRSRCSSIKRPHRRRACRRLAGGWRSVSSRSLPIDTSNSS